MCSRNYPPTAHVLPTHHIPEREWDTHLYFSASYKSHGCHDPFPCVLPKCFFFLHAGTESSFPAYEAKLQNHRGCLLISLFFRGSGRMLGELQEEWRGWEELGHQGGWHGETGPETPLILSFSKDWGGHPEPGQFLSKLAYLERLAVFELQTFPRFFQSLCF